MGSTPEAPETPDPYETAAAQTGTNIATAIANTQLGQVGQTTPYGSLTYQQTGTTTYTDPYTGQSYAIPQYTATTQLTPEQQAIFNSLQQGTQTTAGALAQPFAYTGVPALPATFDPATTPALDPTTLPALAPALDPTTLPALTTTLDPTTLPELAPTFQAEGTVDLSNEAVESYLFELGRLRLDPLYAEQEAALTQQLANQGIAPGSEAYNQAMTLFNQAEADAYNQLLLTGREQATSEILAARELTAAEQAQTYQQSLASQQQAAALQAQAYAQGLTSQQQAAALQAQQFGQAGTAQQQAAAVQNQAYQQALAGQAQQFTQGLTGRQQLTSEQLAQQQAQLNQLGALSSTLYGTVPQYSVTQPAQIPTTDYAGIINEAYQQELAAYEQQVAQQQQALGGLFGLGAGVLTAFSDSRLKKHIRRVGTLDNGLPVYAYQYKSGGPTQIGLLAEDVKNVNPEAVGERDGYMTVFYDMAVQ